MYLAVFLRNFPLGRDGPEAALGFTGFTGVSTKVEPEFEFGLDAVERTVCAGEGVDMEYGSLRLGWDWWCNGSEDTRPFASLTAEFNNSACPFRCMFKIVEEKEEINILEANLKPDRTTYSVLLEAHERNNDLGSMLSTFEEMELVGIEPNITAYNIGLRAAANYGDTMMLEKIKGLIENAGLSMNLNSYEVIFQGLCANQELESALDLLGDMTVSVNEDGLPDENGSPVIDVSPSLNCYMPIIQLALSLHESETAYLVLKMAEVQAGVSKIPAVIYTDVMARAAEDYVIHAVEYCWKKSRELGAFPDEGSCMLILNCAGHEKAPRLSAEVIQYMGESGIEFKEYHFAPLLQAFSLAKKFKSAFNVLTIMRTSGMKPTILTATTCGRLKELNRAMTIFEAASSLGVQVDTDTYNAILTGCITDRNMAEGRNVISLMQSAGVDPNVDTYQSLITLCLTQINYEDAFVYLEEMKSHNVIPSEPIYTSLVRKLARENDPRIKYAVEEMESFGYVVGPNLREYIDTGGLSNLAESERRKQIRIAQRKRSSSSSSSSRKRY
ncbi:hypothetical protein BGZ76_011192 [Entomortierella beljakovae]|nr:hypothetical protein BGZ76_011192 [Entomortierella beljakovae]